MKISTGTLVFNAESILPPGMLWAQLEHLYSFSDEIIITEGATKATDHKGVKPGFTDGTRHYYDGDASWLTMDGRSTDLTVDLIKSFPDPENKIKLIQKNDFWNGKTEMCNEWSKIATGDYLWQVDADEFYLAEDISKIKKILEQENPDAVHFYANHFWGDWDNYVDEKGRKWANLRPWKRIFKHQEGARWMSHEPPEYLLPDGLICNKGNVVDRNKTLGLGIRMFHYSFVCWAQTEFKMKFFKNQGESLDRCGLHYLKCWENWHRDKKTPLIYGDRTTEFLGDHPKEIQNIIDYEYK